ncbi:MAG: Mut7-C ubiquitin/RNAse domain-containing protein [Chromatiales bacterium]|nr:Mut7-C ubiquitin/RNAse domain-containing protein [Chromatiales bacterium]
MKQIDPHPIVKHQAEFRFYQELNDFLPADLRKRSFIHEFIGQPAIKDTIEAIGIPHTEIDLILVEGTSVGFNHRIYGGERIAVYPMFESLDISPLIRLRPKPLRVPRFIADVNLGRLANYLRILGFDTYYENRQDDHEIVERSVSEQRIILTRDLGVLKHGQVTHGYWVRNRQPLKQVEEVLRALQLEKSVRPFSRCSACNGGLRHATPAELQEELPEFARDSYDTFFVCRSCAKIYWRGSHYDRLCEWIDRLMS